MKLKLRGVAVKRMNAREYVLSQSLRKSIATQEPNGCVYINRVL
ncbi:hypothetical protein HMPREF1565_2849 [Providencia alcalifaciens RIMD 1656011]|uniref:Uncharacterized protein n=1 Tax=Providencia alcalifaciens DSM 30120 TaxID=520999 RepID=B6XGV7_9GAMM|nr:hypothetical protein PROVALCAL_02593 [Providencia alcalifaciens DSM 30120]ETT09230.1 hypothetical protein HMPREF1562_2829 [Providencia alcalifaciens F90-2004]EUC97556.1 hypothetical protein HMPREF1567_3172 [Providencia alcalifaciens PAL-2]EUD04844.1 hypothetical protein HMPREF1565_2849 [Providencia alcalifaciens RIMD 1656011]EUD07535.1 hypothetical protein HMPREF1564_1943 [Providencia alcalifaciens R90-1475]